MTFHLLQLKSLIEILSNQNYLKQYNKTYCDLQYYNFIFSINYLIIIEPQI